MKTPVTAASAASVIRLTLLKFDDPDKAPAEDILREAREEWARRGGKGDALNRQGVHQVRSEFRKQVGLLTKENLENFLRAKGELPGEVRGGGGPMPTVAQVVRDMLLKCADPEAEDEKKITAMVRAHWAGLGGDPGEVRNDAVRNARYHIRKQYGDVSKASVRAYSERVAARAQGAKHFFADKTPSRPAGVDAPSAGGAGAPPRPAGVADIGALRRAKEFVNEAGGMSAARRLLDFLEELTT